ncbi:DNA-directed DNA polymerase [Tanacetum coccineum]
MTCGLSMEGIYGGWSEVKRCFRYGDWCIGRQISNLAKDLQGCARMRAFCSLGSWTPFGRARRFVVSLKQPCCAMFVSKLGGRILGGMVASFVRCVEGCLRRCLRFDYGVSRPLRILAYPVRSVVQREEKRDKGKKPDNGKKCLNQVSLRRRENENTRRRAKSILYDFHNNNERLLFKRKRNNSPNCVRFGKKPVGSNEVLTNDQPQITSEHVIQPSNEVQPPLVPFPRRLRKEKDEAQQKKFLENLKQLHINLPFIEALAQMPKYAKFLKGLLTNKARLEEACKIIMNERCSAVLLNKLPSKEKDPGSFTIPCDIGQLHIDNALADLGASISLMPYTMYKKLGLGEPKATRMSLELADRSIQYPRGIIENVLIKVDKFVLPIDFVILDMPEDSRVPIILGRPFLATARAMIDVFNKKITLRVGDDEVIFDVDQSIKRPTTEDDECYGIDDLDETINEEAQELLANEEPDSFLSRGLEKSIDQSDLECCESTSSNEKNGADSENSIRRIDSANTPYPVTQGTTNGDDVKSEHLYSASANEIDEKKPELKNLPQHLEYAYLHGDKSFPIIISSELSEKEKISLLQVLERRKGEIA